MTPCRPQSGRLSIWQQEVSLTREFSHCYFLAFGLPLDSHYKWSQPAWKPSNLFQTPKHLKFIWFACILPKDFKKHDSEHVCDSVCLNINVHDFRTKGCNLCTTSITNWSGCWNIQSHSFYTFGEINLELVIFDPVSYTVKNDRDFNGKRL